MLPSAQMQSNENPASVPADRNRDGEPFIMP